jgi:tocopherol O-methyltransferase
MQASGVAGYYDSNTARFLFVGGSGSALSIHRQLWGPGVRNASEASSYVNGLIATEIERVRSDSTSTILDMGCGVGGTLFHLAASLPESSLHGITISPRQHQLANRIVAEKGLEAQCQIHLGDFLVTPLAVAADVVVAVESFAHAPSPERFFRWASDHLLPGGHMIVVDDFLTSAIGSLGERERTCVSDLRAGWRVPGITTPDACRYAAASVGFEPVDDTDLTALIRLGRPRDVVIRKLSPLLRRLRLARFPFFGNMMGGDALQAGLKGGFLSYRFLVFQKGAVRSRN